MNDKNLLPNSLQPKFLPIFIQICLVLIYIKLQWAFISKKLLNEKNNFLQFFPKFQFHQRILSFHHFFLWQLVRLLYWGIIYWWRHQNLTMISPFLSLSLSLSLPCSTLRNIFLSWRYRLSPLHSLPPFLLSDDVIDGSCLLGSRSFQSRGNWKIPFDIKIVKGHSTLQFPRWKLPQQLELEAGKFSFFRQFRFSVNLISFLSVFIIKLRTFIERFFAANFITKNNGQIVLRMEKLK